MADIDDNVAVPFLGGLDTKTDGKILPVGKLRALKNGIFTEGGTIKKRGGYSSIAPISDTGVELVNPSSVVSHKDDVLMLSDGAISGLNIDNRWKSQDHFLPCIVDRVEMPSVVGEQTYIDSFSNGIVTVYAWVDSRGGVRASVVDSNTGVVYAYDVQVDSSGVQPRITAAGGNIIILYVVEGDETIYSKEILLDDIESSLTAPAATVADDLYTTYYPYDVWYDRENDRSVVAYYTSVTSQILRVVEIDRLGTKIDEEAVDLNTLLSLAGEARPTRISITRLANDRWVVIGCSDIGTIVYRQDFLTDLSASTLTIGSNLAGYDGVADVAGITVSPDLDSGGNAIWGVYSMTGTIGGNWTRFTSWGDWTSGSDDYSVGNCSIRSRAGWTTAGKSFVVLGVQSPGGLQNCDMLYNLETGELVSRVLYGEAATLRGAIADDHQFPTFWSVDGVELNYVTERARRISSLGIAYETDGSGNSTFQNSECMHYSFQIGASCHIDHEEIGDSLYLNTGNLMSYDGFRLAEAGFMSFPELYTTLSSDGSGTNLTNGGTYLYRIYYAKQKSNGEVVRSLALTYKITLGSTHDRVTMSIPTLKHGSELDRTRIEIYRTEANRTQRFHLVTDPDVTNDTGSNRYVINDPTSEKVDFVDDMADTVARTNALDPQSSGVLPIVAPAPAKVMGEAGGRVYLAGGDRPSGLISVSLPYFPGEPLEFADENQFPIEGEGGEIVAMGAIDGVLIVFKERRIYAVSGDGFSATGTGQGFVPQRITTDVGCADPGSIVETPDGLMFKSAKGIYIVTKSFDTQYIGWPVESLNGSTVSSADVIPDTNLVVFLSSDGDTVAYDYFFDQWTTFTNHRGLSSVATGADYRYLRSNGEMYTRDDSVYLDAGAWYALQLRTAPIRLGSIQDYLQVRRVNILGEYLSSHRLQMNVYCDRDLMPFEQRVFEADDVVDTTLWGDTDTDLWGATDVTPWGGEAGASQYRFQHKFKRQKVQTVALEFLDLQTDGAPGQSYELTEMNFEVKKFDGNARVPARSKL